MSREGGKKVKRISTETIIALVVILFVCSASHAQVIRQGDTEVLVTPLGIPCQPGDSILGIFPCPPVEAQGVLIHVRSDDWRTGTHDSYAVTVTYRTATGERKAVAGTVKRERDFGKDWDDGWRAIGLNIGRLQTATLSGITVESVLVAKMATTIVESVAVARMPVVITAGRTEIGPPK